MTPSGIDSTMATMAPPETSSKSPASARIRKDAARLRKKERILRLIEAKDRKGQGQGRGSRAERRRKPAA